jgi:alkaline phosphatase
VNRSSSIRSSAARIAIAVAIVPVVWAASAASRSPSPRGAILFIGDGMGPAYVTLTRVARGGSAGRLRMDSLPYTALARTHSSDSPVTDSAAAASAMACGQKTANGVLCEDATAVYAKRDGRRLESIAVWAKKRGLLVGLVTTTRVTHATPAAFYATQRDRDEEADIARQAVASGFDFILGGGRRYFPDELAAESRTKGWTIVQTAEELKAIRGLDRHVLGLFASSHLPYQAQVEAARKELAVAQPPADPSAGNAGGQEAARTAPTLPEMTRWAIDALKRSGRPFFLMVEGGRIDHAGHANWARTLVDETAAFDESIGYAIDNLDPKTALVLVTADHETGGLAMNGYPDEKDGIWSTYRDPQGSEGDEAYPVVTFMTGPGTKRQTENPPHGPDDPHASGIPLAQAAHTGVDVALYAWGAGADKVHGTVENTVVYSLLKSQLDQR